ICYMTGFFTPIKHVAIAIGLFFFAGTILADTTEWSLASPDKRCEITVSLDSGRLSYHTSFDGKVIIQKSPLGLKRDDEDFKSGLVFKHAGKVEKGREKYELFAGDQPQVNHRVNYRELTFQNGNGLPLELDLAATDEGVAFRYRFAETNNTVRIVESESTGFAVPMNAQGWLQPYHAAGPYTPAYEDFFFHVSPGDAPPDSRQKAVGWAFPVLFHVPDASSWVLITEAGTDASYCACHLAPDSSNGVYHIAFPKADETTGGYTNQFSPEPRFTLPWTMPWRVMIMSQSPANIATSTLVTDLSAPSRIADTSWIKPGRASWAWWAYPDGPFTEEKFDELTDFAVKMGWEYTLFDAGWWKPGLKPIASYALSKGIKPLAWNYAGDFYDPEKRKAKLDEMAAAGIVGIKVDFWCSDRQEAIAAQQALMHDTAARKMVLNLHGCTIPRGWQRTWPNLLSTEAVLGDESYMFEPHYTEKAAELETVLPFTRNVCGPMDVTPVACSPKRFDRTTTAAHELATALIFTSGIIHYADSPQFFESLPPQALQIFRDAPARWDETKCLIGEPGTLAVFARRSGQSWYIAGISGITNALPVTLDLSPYKKYRHRIAVSEAADAKMQVVVEPLGDSNQWQHIIPPRGGFILRLDK
ncbi:MAG TPA: glycoside hydrolase family 97 N-terminal domain-containing protein, partial [Pseudomonadales bacterium]|nr:glycoside hydrolase family 97 N-terminal domain-containing protein [Pseudomonadales bacterium]